MGINAFGANQTAMGQFGTMGNLGMGLDGQAQNMPRGHGRRHSVNVMKSGGAPGLGAMYANPQDGYDDGFVPPAGLGHARSDSSWRISEY